MYLPALTLFFLQDYVTMPPVERAQDCARSHVMRDLIMFGSACRSFLAVLLLSSAAAAAAAEPTSSLLPPEEQLVLQTGFERPILQIIKDEAKAPLHRMSGYDEKGFQIMVRGIVVSVPECRTESVLSVLRTRLAPFGVMVFIVDMNEAIKSDKIAFLKGTDQYEILRVMHTNGDEDDISHEDIIERLKEWEKKYPFSIIGAEHDWVEIEFQVLPGNVKTFAEEVYDFSPDVVDEDLGTVQELAKDLQTTKRLLMWWE